MKWYLILNKASIILLAEYVNMFVSRTYKCEYEHNYTSNK